MVYTESMGVGILHIQVYTIKSNACAVLYVQVVWIQQVRDFICLILLTGVFNNDYYSLKQEELHPTVILAILQWSNGQDEALVLAHAPVQRALSDPNSRPQLTTCKSYQRMPYWIAQRTRQWQVSKKMPHQLISHREESMCHQRREPRDRKGWYSYPFNYRRHPRADTASCTSKLHEVWIRRWVSHHQNLAQCPT